MSRWLPALALIWPAFCASTAFAQPAPEPTEPIVEEAAPADRETADRETATEEPSEPPESDSPAPPVSEEAAPAEAATASNDESELTGRAPGDRAEGAETDLSGEAENSEVEAILEDLAADEAAEEVTEHPLDIYGFAAFTFDVPLYDSDSVFVARGLGAYPHFQVSSLNLYVGKRLDDVWSFLGEVRFLYSPNGDEDPENPTNRIRTVAADSADVQRPLRYGSIEIERVHADANIHELLSLRVGQWLTPYGIWNIDHGHPVVVAIRRPYIVGEELFPERQVGLLASGGVFFDAFRFGYSFGLSNGRGPLDAQRDLDSNKALTARLEARYRGDFTLTVGGSYYRGTYTDAGFPELDVANERTVTETLESYEEQSIGADLQLDWDSLELRAEFAHNEQIYQDGRRRLIAPGQLSPDRKRTGMYGLVGYRTPLWGLMPYVLYEHYLLGDDPALPQIKRIAAYHAGLNLRPWPRVTFKAEYVRAEFVDAIDIVEQASPLEVLDFQLAVAF